MAAVSERTQLAYIAGQAAESRVNVELETDGMTLNIGPQHPATHGTLRIVTRLDGEQVVAAEPIMGYMHRGYEKLLEVRTYPQVNTLVDRIDWLSSFANEVPFILAVERLMEGRTVVVIAHRLSTSQRADRVGVVSGGRLVELGSHDELVAQGGHYAALFASWAGGLARQ